MTSPPFPRSAWFDALMKRFGLALSIGLLAGFASGLVGVGGGIVMVPLLLALLGATQHEAHATSLAAIVLIAGVGAAAFGSAGEVRFEAAVPLAVGGLVGAPVGARVMAGSGEARLKAAFGVITILVGLVMVLT